MKKMKALYNGFMAGMVIGAMTMLLITPDSGRQIRKKIINLYADLNEFMGKTKKQPIILIEQSSPVKASMNEEIEPSIQKLKEDIDKLTEFVRSS